MKKTMIVLLAICSIAFMTGCGGNKEPINVNSGIEAEEPDLPPEGKVLMESDVAEHVGDLIGAVRQCNSNFTTRSNPQIDPSRRTVFSRSAVNH